MDKSILDDIGLVALSEETAEQAAALTSEALYDSWSKKIRKRR